MKITIYFNPNTLSVLDEVHFQQMIIDNTEKLIRIIKLLEIGFYKIFMQKKSLIWMNQTKSKPI